MHYDPFEVRTITAVETTVIQKVLTTALAVYFSAGFGSIAAAMYVLQLQQ